MSLYENINANEKKLEQVEAMKNLQLHQRLLQQ